MSWISSLPPDLQSKVQALVATHPASLDVLQGLWEYKEQRKRKKNIDDHPGPVPDAAKTSTSAPSSAAGAGTPAKSAAGATIIKLSAPVEPSTVIFSLSQMSFQSPLRKRMDLTFHLVELEGQAVPVLSVVNKLVAELSIVNLDRAIRLCVLVPILGNSNTSKKNIVCLSVWIHGHKDPIVCQLNLDQIKKQMVQEGKLPESVLDQPDEASGLLISSIHERIIDYFQRQFRLCGINLINYLPCSTLFKNEVLLHTDTAISLRLNLQGQKQGGGQFVMVEAHKGLKDGSLLFLSENDFHGTYIIFGFKKPILVYEIANIVSTSYSSITRLTFSLLLTVVKNGVETSVEFGMIDQEYFQVIDDFIKAQSINDNSYDDSLKEKTNLKKEKEDKDENLAQVVAGGDADADEDEEDDDYEGGDDSDAGEDSDSDAESGESGDSADESDPDSADEGEQASEDEEEEGEEEDDGVFHKSKEE
ncbi:Rtt106-domain-containing protein [Suhomyces tanzawaensis NRRL Y-17324]|uniref:Histone chaperone RTT106 n=1 Tax=Suhomyces tanzawaensis NRRL Y-17324 TaxID=984487 RepID=A0A1E4SHC3_9ASCO|nr:Rtt106-domain-containing protein [Suhomyces tanzawaensis NRRL Y-17324]ODV78870.1 Rtt106-domain-containing protein [Suhomyces tanzawaensis NRRL Y-17324]